jgi:SpoVK/Ycf46/Vps4 family AAA+-type ATPase
MASGDHLRALLKAYIKGDEAQFHSVAMQIAANEARAGHGKLAEELRNLIDASKVRVPQASSMPIPMAKPRGEVADLLSVSYPNVRLTDMVLDDTTTRILKRVLLEHKTISEIRSHGLAPRKKLLLLGPPGTGKTLTASALAGELGLPLFVVRLDRLITRYMGETAAKLRLVFDAIAQTRAVYLFDEFDSIGSERSLSNDVGEIRRVVNSFLQMVEQDTSDSLIIAATNHADMLDQALFRRFDDIIHYNLPNQERIATALKSKLSDFRSGRMGWVRLAKMAAGLSYGDLSRATEDAIKGAIIERRAVVERDLAMAIAERQASTGRFQPKAKHIRK